MKNLFSRVFASISNSLYGENGVSIAETTWR